MKLIGITGAAGAGKDTLASMLADIWESRGPRVAFKTKFATPIHYIVNYLYGTFGEAPPPVDFETAKRTGVKMPGSERTVREAMQTLGTEWGRNIMGEDYWVNLWRERLLASVDLVDRDNLLVLVSDVRFQNEVDVIHDMGGVVVRVVRDYDEGAGGHASEQVDVLSADHGIKNTGTLDDLRHAAEALLTDR